MSSKASLASFLAVTSSLTWSLTARADDFTVAANDTQTRSGTLVHQNVVIDGTLRVFDSANQGQPVYLYVKAESITINGSIDASGSGFRGADASGNGPGAGGTPAEVAMAMVPAPGGGGAHFGAGGTGRGAGCIAFAGANGGAIYDTMISVYNASPGGVVDTFVAQGLALGSSGGSSFSGPNAFTGRGAHGGAAVVLEAPVIVLNGTGSAMEPTIHANGDDGSDLVGEAPGGGAGGLIWIRSPNFSFTPQAQLQARGGLGGGSTKGNSIGGSGGGGIIILAVNSDVTALTVDVAGGGEVVAGCAQTAGGPGLLDSSLAPPTCFDADGDGFNAAVCDSTDNDCDDSDNTINTMATERCDNVDNDCDGLIDLDDTDSLADLCPSGLECVAGACTPNGTGVGGGGGTGTGSQDEIEVGGGLCAFAAGSRHWSARHWGTLAWLAAAGAALALRRRR